MRVRCADELNAARAYDCTVRYLHGHSTAFNFPDESITLDVLPPHFAQGVKKALRAAILLGWEAPASVATLIAIPPQDEKTSPRALESAPSAPSESATTEEELEVAGLLVDMDSTASSMSCRSDEEQSEGGGVESEHAVEL